MGATKFWARLMSLSLTPAAGFFLNQLCWVRFICVELLESGDTWRNGESDTGRLGILNDMLGRNHKHDKWYYQVFSPSFDELQRKIDVDAILVDLTALGVSTRHALLQEVK